MQVFSSHDGNRYSLSKDSLQYFQKLSSYRSLSDFSFRSLYVFLLYFKQQARDYNNLFRNNQSKVFNDFKAIIDKKSEEEHPTFDKFEKTRKFFTEPDEVIAFWKTLWKKEDAGRPNAE